LCAAPTGSIIAQSDDVVAQKGRFCARREFRAEFDASRNRKEVCSDFWGSFRAREFSLACISLRNASIGAARRSSTHGKLLASSRGLKKYAQKRNEETLMRRVGTLRMRVLF
jgi:hypothetical protein